MEEILAESPRRSYELIRLSRIKYYDNDYVFIDIRLFQRGFEWDEEADVDREVYHPTKKGVQFREDQFQELIGKWTLVPSMLFHPTIMNRAWTAIEQRDFGTAVFLAFKAVEVRIRESAGLPSEMVGISLTRRAFEPESGSLTDQRVPKAEREALSHLFAGAIGLYKNPHSHRDVDMTFEEAFEGLLFASHLMNKLDKLTE